MKTKDCSVFTEVAKTSTEFAEKHKINRQPWAIVGHGAIGLLAAANAVLNGAPPVQLLQRASSTTASFAFSFCQQQQEYPLLISTLASHEPFKYLLIPVKAYAVSAALAQYLGKLADDAQIVLCHNGMGTIEQVLPMLKPSQGLWFASTTHGAYKSSAHRLVHSGQGQTILGAVNDVAKQFVQRQSDNQNLVLLAMKQMLGPCELTEDIQPFLWQKLAINLVINSLTALHNVKNGVLAAAGYQQITAALLDEFITVAQSSGQVFTKAILQAQIGQVIARTAENYSSMLQDVKYGRRSEAEYISGFLLAQAKHYQLELPTIQQLHQALIALERSN